MKKIVVIMLSFMMIMCSMIIAGAADSCCLKTENISVNAGDIFSISVKISGNIGLTAMSLNIDYDYSLIELMSVENGEVFSNDEINVNSQKIKLISWVSSSMSNIDKNGTLLKLKCRALNESESISTKIKFNITQAFTENFSDVNIESSETVVNINNGIKKIKGISLTAPVKTEYLVNEQLDTTGMKVLAEYSDGSFFDVTKRADISEFDHGVIGSRLVVVSYRGYSSAFEIFIHSDKDVLELNLTSLKALPGETIKIPVSVVNNPGISGIESKIKFNSKIFTLEKIIDGNIFSESNMIVGNDSKAQPYSVLWDNAKSKTNINSDGDLGYISLKVNDDAVPGTYTVDFNVSTVVDSSLNQLDAIVNKATVGVFNKKYLFGDVNGDGRTDVLDSTIIQIYLAKGSDNIDDVVGDCDGDGIITILDATKIQNMVAYLDNDNRYGITIYI